MSERADLKETLVKVLGRLQKLFVLHLKVIIVGDRKTSDLLQKIKSDYGQVMKWLLLMPGDWQILLNYQKQLMKLYSDAGLAQFAQHGGETLTSLTNCSNFRHTHAFLMQSVEALNRFIIELYTDKVTDYKDKHSTKWLGVQLLVLEHVQGEFKNGYWTYYT